MLWQKHGNCVLVCEKSIDAMTHFVLFFFRIRNSKFIWEPIWMPYFVREFFGLSDTKRFKLRIGIVFCSFLSIFRRDRKYTNQFTAYSSKQKTYAIPIKTICSLFITSTFHCFAQFYFFFFFDESFRFYFGFWSFLFPMWIRCRSPANEFIMNEKRKFGFNSHHVHFRMKRVPWNNKVTMFEVK